MREKLLAVGFDEAQAKMAIQFLPSNTLEMLVRLIETRSESAKVAILAALPYLHKGDWGSGVEVLIDYYENLLAKPTAPAPVVEPAPAPKTVAKK
jgi:hypothetical protein